MGRSLLWMFLLPACLDNSAFQLDLQGPERIVVGACLPVLVTLQHDQRDKAAPPKENLVTFELEGPGSLHPDAACDEQVPELELPAEASEATVYLSAWRAGEISLTASTEAASNTLEVQATSSHRLFVRAAGVVGEGLVVALDGGQTLAIAQDGTVAFHDLLEHGSAWEVAVQSEPAAPAQSCVASPASGTIQFADARVDLACTTRRFTFGGTVESLAGDHLVLRSNDQERLTVTGDGAFQFSQRLDGTSWSVAVDEQPGPLETCEVQEGQGVLAGADASDVRVTCTSQVRLGGTVAGLVGSGMVLSEGARTLAVAGDFQFPGYLAEGDAYDVQVAEQPVGPRQTCTVAGQGTVEESDVVVAVACETDSFSVGGTVSGLQGTLVLANGADTVAVAQDGPFSLPAIEDGTAYAVEVHSQPATSVCTVASGSGVVSGADVTSVRVTCQPTFTVGGTASGSSLAGLRLALNGGAPLAIEQAGPFTFAERLGALQLYAVTLEAEPVNRACTLGGASGAMTYNDLTTITVACEPTYAITAQVTGDTLEGLLLDLDGLEVLEAPGAGSHTFQSRRVAGADYEVTVASDPPRRDCTVTDGIGTIGTADVVVAVDCVEVVDPEDCGLPGDEDGNTFADCEDPVCVEHPACYELDCTDGDDSDDDGFTDCADEDCWGRGCSVTVATLKSGTPKVAVNSYVRSGSCATAFTSWSSAYLSVASPTGTVRVLPAEGGDWKTCDWSLVRQRGAVGGANPAAVMNVQNFGPVVIGDCGLSTASTAFLPKQLARTGSGAALRAPQDFGSEDLWVGTTTFADHDDTQTWPTYNSTSTTVSTPSGYTWTSTPYCTSTVRQRTRSWRGAGVTSGDPFVRTAPP